MTETGATGPDPVRLRPDQQVAMLIRPLLLGLIPLLGVLWLLNVPRSIGFTFVTATYLSLMMGLAVAAAFLLRPFGRAPGLPELALGALAVAAWTWGGANHEDWLVFFGPRPIEQWLPGAVALALMVEGLRRTSGNAVTGVVVVFLAYAFLGHHLPGVLEAPNVPPQRVVMYLYADTNGVPGLVLGVATTVVLGFILMGAAMNTVGASGFFTDLALAGMGGYRGGPAKVAVVGSTMFGMISGSTVGNVMTSGVVTIPLMKKSGFRPHQAAAVEAVASNGGQLAPPVMGATAFLIAEFLQVPYVEVVFAALLPAVIYYMVLFLQVDVIARREGLAGLPRAQLPRLVPTLLGGWFFVAPIVLLIWLMFGMAWEPGRSALYAAGAMILAGLVFRLRHLGIGGLLSLLPEAGRPLTTLLLICGAAGVVIGSLNLTGVGFLLTNALAHVGAVFGLLAMLVVTAIIAIFLGMGMPTAAVYIVLSIVLAPALVRMGVEPMAAHMFIFYFGLLSMLTPPVAVASYAAGALAEAGLWKTGIAGLQLGVGAFLLPFLFCFNPALVGQGSGLEIVLAVITVVAGSYLLALAVASNGRLVTAPPAERLLLLAGATITATATLWAGSENLLSLVPAALVAAFALGGGTALLRRFRPET